VLDNILEVFDLEPPVGFFFNYIGKNKLNPKGAIPDPYYPANVNTGSSITKKMIVSGYTKQKYSFVEDASFVLLRPDKKVYDKMISMFRKKNYYEYPENVKSGPDEFILTELYDKWTTVSPSYNYRWKLKEFGVNLTPKVYNYGGEFKPWNLERNKYDDLHIWWNVADTIKNLKDYIVPKRYYEKAIVYFYSENKTFNINKEDSNKKEYSVVLISFEENLPKYIYDIFNVICKMRKVDEVQSALLLTQFKEVYLAEYDMMLVHPDLDRYIKEDKKDK
jgi:hypothetical protein